jgi:hypothetical protein
MIEYLLVIFFYSCLIGINILFCGVKKVNLNLIIFYIFVFNFKILLSIIIVENNIYALSNIREYSMYDSAGYYKETLESLIPSFKLNPTIPIDANDVGYNTFLHFIGLVYHYILGIKELNYLLFVFSNAYVVTVTCFLISNYFRYDEYSNHKKIVYLAATICLFEPTLLAFGAVLEREVMVGLLVFLSFKYLIEKKWISLILLTLTLVIFRSTYLYIFAILIILYFVTKNFNYVKRNFLKFIIILFVGFCFSVQIISYFSESAAAHFFRHTASDDLSGFGGIVSKLPYGLSVGLYSLLGYFSPIPFYAFFDDRIQGFYFFGLLQGLGSVTYLFFNASILIAILKIRLILNENKISLGLGSSSEKLAHNLDVIFMGFIVVFLLNIVFQGFAYNIRHKVQIFPLLIFLTFYSIRSIRSIRSIHPECAVALNLIKIFFSCCFVLFALNIIYFALKIIIYS